MRMIPTLSHDEALKALNAVLKHLNESGKAAAVAVADAHGDLIAYLRMDGVAPASAEIARNKAFTAARDRQASGALGGAAKTYGFPVSYLGDDRYTGFAGGLPVWAEGQCVGAIAVSGLSEAEDEAAARVGLAALGLA